MMGDDDGSPDKNQRLVLINDKGIYHVKYSVRNSLDKLKRIAPINKRLLIISSIYHVKYSVRNSLDKRKQFQSYWSISHILDSEVRYSCEQ